MYTTTNSTNGLNHTHNTTLPRDDSNSPFPPTLYEVADIETVIIQATATYHHDITYYLTFIEWLMTTSYHPTIRHSHPLYEPIIEWYTYSPKLDHSTDNPIPTPSQYITTFRNTVRFQSSSVNITHPLTPCELYCGQRLHEYPPHI